MKKCGKKWRFQTSTKEVSIFHCEYLMRWFHQSVLLIFELLEKTDVMRQRGKSNILPTADNRGGWVRIAPSSSPSSSSSLGLMMMRSRVLKHLKHEGRTWQAVGPLPDLHFTTTRMGIYGEGGGSAVWGAIHATVRWRGGGGGIRLRKRSRGDPPQEEEGGDPEIRLSKRSRGTQRSASGNGAGGPGDPPQTLMRPLFFVTFSETPGVILT